MNHSLLTSYVRLLIEGKSKLAQLSGDRTAEWGSDDHVADLEARVADAVYWRDKHPKGSERRGHYRNIYNTLRRELQSARKRQSKPLTEGGLVGHLMHLYDNRDLTFREIKTILRKAASGRLEAASEKMDGMNLVFTYDVGGGQVLAARNSGDIKGGGVDAAAIATKFAGRGSVEEAFNSALRVLQGAIGSLPKKVQTKVFGPSSNRWYSMEIVYTKNPNVINYDSNNIVFHGWPVFKRDAKGNVTQSEDEVGGIDILTQYVDRMQAAVTSTGWRVRGPALVRMQKLSDGSVFQDAVAKIDEAMGTAGVGDSDTVGTYLTNLMTDAVTDLGLEDDVAADVVSRCLGEEGGPTLVAIKKKLPKSQVDQVVSFVRNSPVLLKSFVSPIEIAINDFAVELLKGLKSTLIDDTDREVQRLRGEVDRAISAIEASGDETAMTVLAQQMGKLQGVENITSPMEGVVFIYKGNAYKFTGSFAAANQILGLFKYGRKGKKL